MDVIEAKTKHEVSLIQISGVVGVSADRVRKKIVVYVAQVGDCGRVPKNLEGYQVECKAVGQVRAHG